MTGYPYSILEYIDHSIGALTPGRCVTGERMICFCLVIVIVIRGDEDRRIHALIALLCK